MAIYVKDLQGRYVSINHRCEAAFRISREWVVDKTDDVRARVAQAQRGEPAELFEEQLLRPDGSTIYVEAVAILARASPRRRASSGTLLNAKRQKRSSGRAKSSIGR